MILHREIGDGVVLAPVNPWMTEDIWKAVDGNREHLGRWLPWVDASESVESTREFMIRTLEQFARKETVVWAILVDRAVQGLVGFASINNHAARGEIGYWLAEDATGRGIMTACVAEVENISFNELGLEKLEIRAAAGNRKSRAIPERLGYRLEGTLRRQEKLAGGFVDHVVYGKLKSEWSG